MLKDAHSNAVSRDFSEDTGGDHQKNNADEFEQGVTG